MSKMISVVVVGLLAASAGAGQFYINEASETPSPIMMSSSQTGTLSLYYNLWEGETLRGFQIYFTQDSHAPYHEVVDATGEETATHDFDFDRSQAGMPQLPAADGEGIPLAQRAGVLNGYVGVGYDIDGADVLTGPMEGILLDQVIVHELSSALPREVRVYNSAGEMPFDTRTAFQQASAADFPPLDPWVFPVPTPGFQQFLNGGQDHPLMLVHVPEPVALAYLALGGLALFRRR